jgi:hypothetical protein
VQWPIGLLPSLAHRDFSFRRSFHDLHSKRLMKPTLPDAFRFAGGASLRIEIVLKPLLREAAEKALARREISLTAIEAAVITVLRNDADFGEIVGALENANASIAATRSDTGDYVFSVAATHAGRQRNVVLRDVMVQIIGRSEVYFSQVTEVGPVAVAKLKYVADDASAVGSVVVSVFTQAFLRRVPPSLHSLLPAELKVATLSVVDDPVPHSPDILPI